ncbi:hypothetical protein [Actinokineospora iranica]|uniref:Uncharacterized protein n=1 Tax=Actinokineospora iranica TaxID=1271860 RepID=A0A1G6IUD2_9PSEU|nr:hypothetical protein [Actinokineospora iranica]SDC10117.1 hypothetical protein SAMN05216174_101105 [Actinokineospora iranica]
MRNPGAFVAAGCALAYTAAKVDLALRGELGLPGFPTSAETTRDFEGSIALAQWGNAAVGLAVAALAITLTHPRGGLPLRLASWVGATLIGAGVAGFALRAITDPPAPAGWATLAVGALWVASWIQATVAHRHLAASPTNRA